MKKYLYILSFCLLQCSLTGFAQSEDTSISDTITLPEVTISAERPYVQRKADRMIVGVEHSKLLKARSLSNISNLIPGISYDGEGGVTFMGNAVKIYENGRMLKLSGAQLKRYLSSLRGNDIENLEILSHATAEYDAEGGSGILVINRRRRHEYGLSGYVGSEYERKSSNSFSEFAGLTYSWGSFAFYANMTLGQSESHSKIKESDFGQDLTVRSISESTDKGLYYMPKLGFDFYISPNQYLGVEWSGNYSKDYSECIEEAKQDQRINARPELKQYPKDIEKYDLIYLGYPNYWGIAAWPVDTFVKANDFNGKTVIPFCTSSSSGLGQSGELLAEEAN